MLSRRSLLSGLFAAGAASALGALVVVSSSFEAEAQRAIKVNPHRRRRRRRTTTKAAKPAEKAM